MLRREQRVGLSVSFPSAGYPMRTIGGNVQRTRAIHQAKAVLSQFISCFLVLYILIFDSSSPEIMQLGSDVFPISRLSTIQFARIAELDSIHMLSCKICVRIVSATVSCSLHSCQLHPFENSPLQYAAFSAIFQQDNHNHHLESKENMMQ